MINLASRNNRCRQELCNKSPSYNYSEKKQGIYCAEHAQIGMINVTRKYYFCQQKSCNKSPSYNYPENKQGIYCAVHAKENMINVKKKAMSTRRMSKKS